LPTTTGGLCEAILRGLDLTGADLSGRDLRGADLTGANLTNVNLTGCHLAGCKLRGAKMQGARLGRCRGQPADTGQQGIQRGSRVLTTAAQNEWGPGAPRVGTVTRDEHSGRSPGNINVKWDGETHEHGDWIKAATCVLLGA
jgi:hypothetical protein